VVAEHALSGAAFLAEKLLNDLPYSTLPGTPRSPETVVAEDRHCACWRDLVIKPLKDQ
jgi:hypothetical protein